MKKLFLNILSLFGLTTIRVAVENVRELNQSHGQRVQGLERDFNGLSAANKELRASAERTAKGHAYVAKMRTDLWNMNEDKVKEIAALKIERYELRGKLAKAVETISQYQ